MTGPTDDGEVGVRPAVKTPVSIFTKLGVRDPVQAVVSPRTRARSPSCPEGHPVVRAVQ